ncbi:MULTISPECIES: hypothetical protein [unclassified Paracoccus (in: a-proteobacteria)]|uniref:hypothetical protein n=1 Tax=unclassified Paracoccus (in: a-proteobacteria) TaxID=2688777 RepID=UPI0012B3ADA1|nr:MULTISPECIES: hypothetical protein [unclassified Paracoccus (in: a-proteobacteria)]UXU73774.1 hypothetical protein GB879_007440 [Paracoccus sp. SMMA_5]UXU79664.1 hypothetical protein GB880_007430 [Paracoccus sp. SMMA_5_TC]
MTDAPERIWAVPERNCTVYMSGNSPITAQDGPFTHRLHGAAPEYIRADLVEAMETENQRLREALSPFADVAEHDIGTDEADCDVFRPMLRANRAPYLTVGDLRRARAALSSTGEKG